MNIERTVTINLPKNVDAFFVAYAKLLKYKSVEDCLKEEIEWHLSVDRMRNSFEIYFDDQVLDEIARRYGLQYPKVKVEAT